MKTHLLKILVQDVLLNFFGTDAESQHTNRFEPPDGSALFILGQSNNDEMTAYMESFPDLPKPAGYAYYTNLNVGIPGHDVEAMEKYVRQYPNSVRQLAI